MHPEKPETTPAHPSFISRDERLHYMADHAFGLQQMAEDLGLETLAEKFNAAHREARLQMKGGTRSEGDPGERDPRGPS